MPRLKDLKPSILELSIDESRHLVRTLRQARRDWKPRKSEQIPIDDLQIEETKKRKKRTVSKGKKKESILETLGKLNEQDRKAILDRLKEILG